MGRDKTASDQFEHHGSERLLGAAGAIEISITYHLDRHIGAGKVKRGLQQELTSLTNQVLLNVI